jgi:hypothetical protein
MRLAPVAVALFAGVSLLAPLTAQPVVHLTFDNPAQLGRDSSGRGRNGATNGTVVASTTGVAGGAAQFDGSSSIDLDGSVASVFSGDFTLSLWVATTVTSGGSGDSAFDGRGILTAVGNNSPTVALGLTGGVVGFAHANEEATLHSQSSVNTGSFVHVVVTQNSATGARSVFVNGSLDNQHQGSTISTAVHDILSLGGNPGQSSSFAGLIDDFQIYNAALNASEVAYLHANPGSAVGLLAVPEPSSLVLLSLGAGVVAVLQWHRWRNT